MRRVEAVKRPVSYADLQRMPDDGNRYELYDGELCVVPSPLPGHQIVSKRLFLALFEWTRREGGDVFYAPFDIVFSEYNVVQPDLIYFGPDAARRIRPDEHVRFPPDAAFEVLSPSTARIDRGRKRDLMARYRVPEYWVIDPNERTIEISRLTGSGYAEPLTITNGRCVSSIIPGFEVDLERLFAGLDV
jgi:Uma2 family endonuclease